MVTRAAEPAAALDVARSISDISYCDEVTNSCPQSFRAPGGVVDVAVSDDGNTVAFITSEALLATDTDPQTSQPQFRRDVYVRGPNGALLLVTDDDHPGTSDNRFWTVGTEVDISGDGRYVTWTMADDQSIILFYPGAVPVDDALDDADRDTDVYVATVDADGDGQLDAAAGPEMLASVDDAEANLSRNSFEPSISRDGRFIAFAHFLTGQPTPTEVRLVDRDVDEDGVFDEPGADQSSVVVNPGTLAPFSTLGADEPEVAPDGGFVTFRAFELLAPSSSGLARVWRRSDNTTFEVTAGDFTGGTAGTVSRWPSISADGTTVAYDFETIDDAIVSDIPFGRNQTVVVRLDPGAGVVLADDPSTAVFEGPYIASQDPTDPDPSTAISDSSRESFPSLSDDGRYVIYESNADNVAGHIGSGAGQIYAVDLLQVDPVDRVPVIVSANDFAGPGDDGSFFADVAGSGSTVAFGSNAGNLAQFPTITADPNAFVMRWQVNVQPTSGPVAFPDTAVGASSAPLAVTFDTDDFGPWTGDSLDFFDGYIDPAVHDYSVVGGCASPTISFHANDPCAVQVTFSPVEVGNRVAELCLTIAGQFGCSTTVVLGGQALVPDDPGPLVRESLTDDDQQIGAEGSSDPAISADGRYVAFTTDSPLDAADQNFLDDVYVRDRLRGTTTLISSGEGIGDIGPDESVNPTISGDGRFLTFESTGDKTPDPTAPEGDGGRTDVYRVDRGAPDPATGDFVPGAATMQIVSVDTDGGDVSIFDDVGDAAMSGDGTQIAFTVFSGEGPTNVLIRDLGSGAPNTVRLDSVMPSEVSDIDQPDVSADGRHVAVVGETELGIDGEFPIVSDVVYVYDRDVDGDGVLDEPNDPTPGQTRVVQVTTGEFTPVGDPDPPTGPADFRDFGPLQDTRSSDPAISGDGATVAYAFEETYDFNNAELPMDERLSPLPAFDDQIIVADRDPLSGLPALSEIASLAGPGDANKTLFENIAENAGRCLTGGEGCGPSSDPDLSDDGRYVTFATQANNLMARPAESLPGFLFCGDPAPCDILAVDRDATSNAGAPQHVNEPLGDVLDLDQFIDREVGSPAISGDGRFIVFDTGAEFHLGYFSPGPQTGFLLPVDSNGEPDVYLREWQPVVDAPGPIAFPETQLGLTSAAQTATFSTQDFGPAPVLAVEILGANPGDFLISSALNCLPPLPGAPPPSAPVPPVPVHGRAHLGDPCSVSVAFRPTGVGVRNAVLRVTTGHPFSVPTGGAAAAANQVTEIPLTGGGAGLGGFGSAPSVDLGSQIVTVTSPEVAIPVTNTGNTPFQITDVTLGGTNPGDFTIVGTDCIGFLAPGASCTVRVTFTPTAPGERSATLVFTDTAPGGPHLVGLTGRAPAPTLIVNPGVVSPGRTVQIQGLNWAPGQVVTITTADAFDPTETLPGTTQITANAFGGIDGSLLFFPKTITGPRIVVATGTPNTLTAFQPLLISVATINGLDFVNRG